MGAMPSVVASYEPVEGLNNRMQAIATRLSGRLNGLIQWYSGGVILLTSKDDTNNHSAVLLGY